MARMSASCGGRGLDYSGSLKIHLGPKDHSTDLTENISCTATKRELLAFPIPISTIPGTNTTNPASFLSGLISEPLVPDCLETIETVYSSRPDLKEEPLEDAQDSWFTDGSSIVGQGIRKARYAVTTAAEVVCSQSLPARTSAQKAETIALTRALELTKGKR